MIVVDASVILGALIADKGSDKIENLIAAEDWLVAPELIDLEIANGLRRIETLAARFRSGYEQHCSIITSRSAC